MPWRAGIGFDVWRRNLRIEEGELALVPCEEF